MVPTVLGIVFVILSVVFYIKDFHSGGLDLLLGLIACISIIVFMIRMNKKPPVIVMILAKYTMSIYLMHTLFAASLRTVLFKIGVQSAAVHVVLGLVISFVGPMAAEWIMQKSKWLEFFLYPGKLIKIK